MPFADPHADLMDEGSATSRSRGHKMATTTKGATSQALGINNFASGSFTSDGNDYIVTLGFKPRWVKVVNSTDTIIWEKIEGMAAANSIKTLAGTTGANDTVTTSIDTGSAILINADGTISLSATLADTAKAISWIAMS